MLSKILLGKIILGRATVNKGYFFAIIAAVLYAIIHVTSKPILEPAGFTEINPVVMAFLIYIITTIFFIPICKKSSSPIKSLKKKDLFFMMLIGVFEVSALITYFFGIKDSSAINASVFSNGEIVFSLIIAITIFKETLSRNERIPFGIIIVGLIFLPLGSEFFFNEMSFSKILQGDLLILLSGILYAIDVSFCRYVGNNVDSTRMTQVVSFFCAAFALFLLFLFEIPFTFEIEHIFGVLIIAIFGTGLSTLLFLKSLKRIGVVRTILLYSTTSIFGIIFSVFLLSEKVGLIEILSIASVIFGIFLLRNKLGSIE